ncbi:hypothetical protein [Absidia glauca]|uniref:Isopentenyl phosphate kinase n=1 Tax=Absidia glauca TaxID=4829 RepID=A0A168NHF5_ABSGL|nr:hypothetical protein [Absidia glauca]
MTTTTIIKLGGAAITNKHCEDELSPHLDRIVDEIVAVHPTTRLVLIHGAGGFGHPPAKHYALKQGWTPADPHKKLGFAMTRCHVLDLHHHLLTRLIAKGLPVVSVSPFEQTCTSGGVPSSHLGRRVEVVLQAGLIPLLYGDAVLDAQWGCTILSGDVIMRKLAQTMAVDRCVFVTDVSGVYTANPKTDAGATLVRQIIVDPTVKEVVMVADDDDDTVADVTGGMQAKIQCAREIVCSTQAQVVICRSLTDPTCTVFTAKPTRLDPLPFLICHGLALTLYYIITLDK